MNIDNPLRQIATFLYKEKTHTARDLSNCFESFRNVSQNDHNFVANFTLILYLLNGCKIMQHKASLLIRYILGYTSCDLRPLTFSIAETADLLFEKNLPWDELRITKHIYPAVAKKLNKKAAAISRSAERLANKVWEQMDEQKQLEYIGRIVPDIHSTSDLVVYLAYYVYWDTPYFEMIKRQYDASR